MTRYSSLGLGLLLMFIFSCNNDEWNNIKGKAEADKIEFAVKLQVDPLDMDEEPWVTTRGTPLKGYEDMSSMGMFCFVTDNSFATDGPTAKPTIMNNLRLNSRLDGGAQYWDYLPDEDVIWEAISPAKRATFFGYAPYGVVDGNGISIITDYENAGVGAPVLRYKVPTDVKKQSDLLVAEPRKDVVRTENSVQLVYKHMLTAVGFKISGTGEQVSKIIIKGIATQADLSLDIPLSASPVWNNFVSSTTGSYEASIKKDPGKAYYTATATPTDVIEADGYLMMIPQNLTADATAIVELSDGTQKGYSLSVKEWKPGKKVVYSINVSPTSLVITPANWLEAKAKGGTIKITVKGAIWKASIDDNSAFTMSDTQGFDGAKITLTWPENSGNPKPATRFATIKFTAVGNGHGQIEFPSSQLGMMVDYIPHNGVKWSKGPLISDGEGGCKIGDPTDGGLYFQYCSLIGYRGGSDGSGTGLVNPAWDSKYWGGSETPPAPFSDDIVVYPKELLPENGGIGLPTKWHPGATSISFDQKYFFGLTAYPFNDENTYYNPNIISPHVNYTGFLNGDLYPRGIGDPCLYYLGEGWLMPTIDQYWALLNNTPQPSPLRAWTLDEVGAEYTATPQGVYFASKRIFFTATGLRYSSNGKFSAIEPMRPDGGSPVFYTRAIEVWGDLSSRAFFYYYNWEPVLQHTIEIYGSERGNALPARCVYNR